MKYVIYLNDNLVVEVANEEEARRAFAVACNLADIVNGSAKLIDGNTGEVLDWDGWNT